MNASYQGCSFGGHGAVVITGDVFIFCPNGNYSRPKSAVAMGSYSVGPPSDLAHDEEQAINALIPGASQWGLRESANRDDLFAAEGDIRRKNIRQLPGFRCSQSSTLRGRAMERPAIA
jgi:hypothetical protein